MLTTILSGQSVFNSLDTPVSVRSLSLSNGANSVASSVLTNNPAGLDCEGKSFGGQFLVYPADIKNHILHFTSKTNLGIWSGVLSVMDFGNFSDDITGETFTANDLVFRIGYKTVWSRHISWGVSAGTIRSKIQNYTSSGIFFNAGVRSRILQNRMGLGISVENMGKMLTTYAGINEQMNGQIRYSMYYHPLHLPATLSLDYLKTGTQPPKVILAAELVLNPKLTLWIGTNSNRFNLVWGNIFHSLTAGISGGLRVPVGELEIDVGIQNLGAAGNVIGIGLERQFRRSGK